MPDQNRHAEQARIRHKLGQEPIKFDGLLTWFLFPISRLKQGADTECFDKIKGTIFLVESFYAGDYFQ